MYKHGTDAAKTATYGFDNLSRLTTFALTGNTSQSLAYDLNGNRASKAVDASTLTLHQVYGEPTASSIVNRTSPYSSSSPRTTVTSPTTPETETIETSAPRGMRYCPFVSSGEAVYVPRDRRLPRKL